MQTEKIEECRKAMEGLTNNYGCRPDLAELAAQMTRMHRTLVQSFTGGFVVPFIREMARLRREERFDGRNEAACDACLAMCEALEKKYDVKPEDPLQFACI